MEWEKHIMKWIALTLTVLTIILAILYLAIGGTILAIGLGTIAMTTLILAVFSVGIWYAHRSIQLGANLAIEAQNNNDKWDSIKMQSLTKFGGDMLKLKGQNTDNGYPLLESGNDAFDASFTIQGIDED